MADALRTKASAEWTQKLAQHTEIQRRTKVAKAMKKANKWADLDDEDKDDVLKALAIQAGLVEED